MPEFVVYGRPGCHLCEQLTEALIPFLRGRATVAVRNIDTNADWRTKYGMRIPVVECGGRVLCESRLDPAAIEEALSAVHPAERI